MLTAVSAITQPARSEDAGTINDLWERRAAVVVKYRRAREDYNNARKRMPKWALIGPQYINAKGEKCGPTVGWPEVADVAAVGLPEHEGSFRAIRPSPLTAVSDFKLLLGMCLHNPERRKELKLRYREKLARIRERLNQKKQEEDRSGLTAATVQLETHGDALYEIEEQIIALEDYTAAGIAAVACIEIGRDISHDDVATDEPEVSFHVRILRSTADKLNGRLGADVRAILSGLPLKQIGGFC